MRSVYSIVFSLVARAEFDHLILSNRKLGEQIKKVIDRLSLHPDLGKFLKGEWKGYRSYRTGDYRIVYRIEHAKLIIYIITIDNRKSVYD